MSRASEIELAEAVMIWWRKRRAVHARGRFGDDPIHRTPPEFVVIAARILGIEEADV